MSGIDPQTKKFTEPPEQIKKEIAALKADKTILCRLRASCRGARPISYAQQGTAPVGPFGSQRMPAPFGNTPVLPDERRKAG